MGGWDPITPLKPHLGDGFARLVGRLQAAIDTRYALPSWTDESHARHKHADRLAAASEAYHVVGWRFCSPCATTSASPWHRRRPTRCGARADRPGSRGRRRSRRSAFWASCKPSHSRVRPGGWHREPGLSRTRRKPRRPGDLRWRRTRCWPASRRSRPKPPPSPARCWCSPAREPARPRRSPPRSPIGLPSGKSPRPASWRSPSPTRLRPRWPAASGRHWATGRRRAGSARSTASPRGSCGSSRRSPVSARASTSWTPTTAAGWSSAC